MTLSEKEDMSEQNDKPIRLTENALKSVLSVSKKQIIQKYLQVQSKCLKKGTIN